MESEVGPALGGGGEAAQRVVLLWGPGERPTAKKTFSVVFAAGTCIPE